MSKFFLSHASFDSDLAMFLKDFIESSFDGIGVFCSSDPTDLPLGTKWPEEVQNALKDSNILLLLATTRSLARPWVWFETGTFWFTGKKIIPLCVGQVRKDKLPTPLYELQSVNLDEEDDLHEFVKLCKAYSISEKQKTDVSKLLTALRDKERKILDAYLSNREGWIGVSWESKFLSYDGPIEGLKLIEDQTHQESMSDALKKGGFSPYLALLEKLSEHANKGRRIIYLTDRASWRGKIVNKQKVLVAKPVIIKNNAI